VIASLGTALTERQVSALKRLTRTVVLALDADAAGDEAVLRGLDVARQVFADERVPVPLPQGLVRLESRLGADIFIASLPRGRDPDEIIRESPDRWREIIDSARPIVDYYFDVVLGRADLSSTKGATAVVRQLLPIVGEVRDPVQQALYLQRLADRVKIAEQLLASELARLRLAAKAPEMAGDRRDPEIPRRRSALDEHAVGLLLLYPAQARDFANALENDDLDLVESREVVDAIRRHVAAGGQPERAALAAAFPEPVAEWLEAVLREQEAHPALDERAVAREQERLLRELRRRADRKRIATYSAFLRELEGEPSADATEMYRRVEEALARLQTSERLSRQARVWSNLA
jgi:DNA primase